MEYITIRPTNLVNANGNDMGKVSDDVRYTVESKIVKNIKGINRLLVLGNRYVPLIDVLLVVDVPPPPPIVTTYPDRYQIRYPDAQGNWTRVWQEYQKVIT